MSYGHNIFLLRNIKKQIQIDTKFCFKLLIIYLKEIRSVNEKKLKFISDYNIQNCQTEQIKSKVFHK